MKVTIELRNACGDCWLPDKTLCKTWITTTLDSSGLDQDCSVSLSFVDKPEAARINAQYRGKDTATNVLSFPSDYPANLSSLIKYRPLGDIIICPAIIEQEAVQQEKILQAHWAHMLVHGVLHLLGHDHSKPEEATRMEQLEITILRILGIPNPYLIG